MASAFVSCCFVRRSGWCWCCWCCWGWLTTASSFWSFVHCHLLSLEQQSFQIVTSRDRTLKKRKKHLFVSDRLAGDIHWIICYCCSNTCTYFNFCYDTLFDLYSGYQMKRLVNSKKSMNHCGMQVFLIIDVTLIDFTVCLLNRYYAIIVKF